MKINSDNEKGLSIQQPNKTIENQGNNGSGEENSAAGNPQRSISFNVNGVSRLQNNTRIDGSSVIYPWLPTNTVYVPPAESIQEVNVVTNAFDAEQGLAGGAAVNVSIKTGGNDFHGVGWGYDTNSRFLSRRYFQPTNQAKNPKKEGSAADKRR